MSGATTFDTQQLLFGSKLSVLAPKKIEIAEHYYIHGWQIFDEVPDEQYAVSLTKSFINSVDSGRLSLDAQFKHRIELAKADHIPVCDDIVSTSYQVLHFDMGQPLLEGQPQLLVTHVGIYVPTTTRHRVTARTRILELNGLLKGRNVAADTIEKHVKDYVSKYGDGWSDVNTNRLACFARFLDALSMKPELQNLKDKTVGQWFQSEERLNEDDAHKYEVAYYAKQHVDLKRLEKQIALQPGQLLILDNARVVHGRIGNRKAKELFNFMFGIQQINDDDIAKLRSSICALLVE